MDRKSKAYLIVGLIFISLISGFIGYTAFSSSLISDTTIESGSLAGDASYILFVEGSTYYAKNGITGAMDYSETVFSTLFNTVADLLTGGGVIKVLAGRYPIAAELGIDYRGIRLIGMGNNLTVFYPTADINIIRIKLPAYSTNHNYMENYEMGAGIYITDIQFWDKADSPSQTSKACIVLDYSVTPLTGVNILDCSFVGIYDGIIGYRASASYYCYFNRIERCRWSLVRHYGTYFENVSDFVFNQLSMVTDLSDVPLMYFEYKSGGSTKIGGVELHQVSLFNEKTVNTAHGLYMEDYHEVWISDSIFDFCGGWGAYFKNVYALFITNSWFSSNSRATSGETGGFYLCSNDAHESTYGNPYDVILVNLKAENNEGGIGYSLAGTSGHEMDQIQLTNCISRSNADNDGFNIVYANHVTLMNCVAGSNGDDGFYDDNTCDYNAYIGCTGRGNVDNWDLTSGGVQYHLSWDADTFTD